LGSTGLSERTAQRYTQLDRKSATVADLPTVRAAVAQIERPKPKMKKPDEPRPNLDDQYRFSFRHVQMRLGQGRDGDQIRRELHHLLDRATTDALRHLAEERAE
jgi:hypothetical protein